jgi:hypothetical protein
VFLSSDLARFVTGQTLIVDGGLALRGSVVDGVLDTLTGGRAQLSERDAIAESAPIWDSAPTRATDSR